MTLKIEVNKHLSKKNNRDIFFNRKTGRAFPGKSEDLKNTENWMIMQMRSQTNQLKSILPIKGDLHISFRFFFDNYYTKKGERNKKIPDLNNLIHLPSDCLQAAGIIEDDTDICSIDGSSREPSGSNYLIIDIKEVRCF